MRAGRLLLAALVLVLAAALLYVAVIRRLETALALRRASVGTADALSSRVPDYERPAMARSNLAVLEPAYNGSPDDQRVAMLHGSNLLAVEQARAAEESYRQALAWGQRPEIYVALASAQAASGEREQAIASLGKALAFDPYSVVGSDLPDLRAEALRRFEATATPAQRAEVYLNMAIGYLHDGFPNEAVEMTALAAINDSRILTRPELLAWGDVAWVALRRYPAIRREHALTR